MADPRGLQEPSAKKKLYIETVGCQMNVLDSELVVGKLRDEGYELTDDIGLADTILYNTCSVRQLPEDKVYSALGRIKGIKAATGARIASPMAPPAFMASIFLSTLTSGCLKLPRT